MVTGDALPDMPPFGDGDVRPEATTARIGSR
jgi:hypothetical protein